MPYWRRRCRNSTSTSRKSMNRCCKRTLRWKMTWISRGPRAASNPSNRVNKNRTTCSKELLSQCQLKRLNRNLPKYNNNSSSSSDKVRARSNRSWRRKRAFPTRRRKQQTKWVLSSRTRSRRSRTSSTGLKRRKKPSNPSDLRFHLRPSSSNRSLNQMNTKRNLISRGHHPRRNRDQWLFKNRRRQLRTRRKSLKRSCSITRITRRHPLTIRAYSIAGLRTVWRISLARLWSRSTSGYLI